MKIGQWYIQTFRDGDEIFFTPTAEQKNGGLAGVSYTVYADRPRAKAKPKKDSVSRLDRDLRRQPSLWRWIAEDKVPKERFAS